MKLDMCQNRIGNILNDYLEWHSFPFRLDRAGICNGLSSVYVQYARKGMPDAFLQLLKKIATMPPCRKGQSQDLEVNYFITEILKSAKPTLFDLNISDSQSMKALDPRLTSSLGIALATSDESWEDILKQINLAPEETLLVRNTGHSIAISKINGIYVVYDPNYKEGLREFDTEQKLVNELHHRVFGYKEGPLGLQIDLYRSPNNPSRALGSVTPQTIYATYLKSDTINATAAGRREMLALHRGPFKTLERVVYAGGSKADVEQLVALGANDLYDAALAAIAGNNVPALSVLLPKITSDMQRYMLLLITMRNGRNIVLEALLEDEKYNEYYKKLVTEETSSSITMAVTGGSAPLLEKMIQDYKMYAASEPDQENKLAKMILKKTGDDDDITRAIDSDHFGCIRILIETADLGEAKLSDQQKFAYLLLAIRKNKYTAVRELIEFVPKASFKHLSMSLHAVERTDYEILHILKHHKVPFSEEANALIEKKRTHAVTTRLAISIILIKCIEFFKEAFSKEKHSKMFGVCDANFWSKPYLRDQREQRPSCVL